PLTSNYLNLIKNSSLAVAIAYPDLVSVFAGTVLNQTGQAVEVILITMLVYLSLSLLTSLFMNWFNARMALVERQAHAGRSHSRRLPGCSCLIGSSAPASLRDRDHRLDAAQPVLLL